MGTISSTLRIETIIFDNVDTKVLIKGEIFKNHLSYSSEMFISFSELNLLLNCIQTLNPSVNVSDLFVEEMYGGNYSQTSFNIKMLENNEIDFAHFSAYSQKKLIRA